MKHSSSGFTLLELLLRISIVGVLIALLIPSWLRFWDCYQMRNASEQTLYTLTTVYRDAQRTNQELRIAMCVKSGVFRVSDSYPSTSAPQTWHDIYQGPVQIRFPVVLKNSNYYTNGTCLISQYNSTNDHVSSLGSICFASKYTPRVYKYQVGNSTLLGYPRTMSDHTCGT